MNRFELSTKMLSWLILQPARDWNYSPALCEKKLEPSVQIVCFVFGSNDAVTPKQAMPRHTFNSSHSDSAASAVSAEIDDDDDGPAELFCFKD